MPQDEDLLTESFSGRRKCFTIFQRITVVSNLIFALFAILLVVLGAVAVRALQSYSELTKVSIPAGLIVLGLLLLFIIFLGLYGSFKKNTKFLAAYFVLLFIFIICEFGVGGGSYALRSQVPQRLENSWALIPDQDRNNFQNSFGCCGWSSVTDNPGSNCVSNTTTNHTANSTRPMERSFSIVREGEVPNSIKLATAVTNNSTLPCQADIVNFFIAQLYAVGTLGIVFATLQLLALLSSIIVCGFIRVEQSRNQEERF